MWRTSQGMRTLDGAEAELVTAAIGDMWRQLEEDQDSDDPWTWGLAIFDGLQWEQKTVQLAAVGGALLKTEVSAMPLTAVNEATVGVIFEHIRQSVQVEIDTSMDIDESLDFWRKKVLAVIDDESWPADEPLPDSNCTDFGEWDWMIEAIGDGILWDDDWCDASFIMDVAPETANRRKDSLGIDDDYYRAIAPDPSEADIAAARVALETFRNASGGT
jgi:hypothetical protein